MAKKEIRFHIEGTTPQILPMVRLVEYLKELAILCGHPKHVHFLRVETGSAPCVLEVDEKVESKIIARIERANANRGPQDAIKANRSLVSMLKKDRLSAEFRTENGEVKAVYPLQTDKRQETFGPYWRDGFVDGIVVRLGGIDETLPVHLLYEGRYYICNATREIVRQLGPKILGDPVRVHGRGRWYRNEQGEWEMMVFDINRVEDLNHSTLADSVSRLRKIEDNGLYLLGDPLGEMHKIRNGE